MQICAVEYTQNKSHVEAAKSTNSVMERIMAKVFMFHVLVEPIKIAVMKT